MTIFDRAYGIVRREVSYVDVTVTGGDPPSIEVQAWAVGSDGEGSPCPEIWVLGTERLGEVIGVLEAARDEALERIVPGRGSPPDEEIDWDGLADIPSPGDESAP